MILTPRRLGWFLTVGCAVWLTGCGDSEGTEAKGGKGGAGGEGGGPVEDAICLLHNCTEDAHCGGCDKGRTSCKLDEGRCVACDANTVSGCAEGEYCTSWGNCAPNGVTCMTDNHGVPQIGCSVEADCIACDPAHQVCSNGLCVGCTAEDVSECASDDVCVDNKCSDKCPASCETDSDCGNCSIGGVALTACKGHKCAECSGTQPCPDGLICGPQGVCKGTCGLAGNGGCNTSADCAGCGPEAPICHPNPVMGQPGTCGPAAMGCSDLGESAPVLPAPYNKVTNLCSSDSNCVGVGAELNVGKMLRDLTGLNSIGDAIVDYPMSQCAAVSLGGVSCGVCVPCEVDSDCSPIDIDQVALEAFGALGSLAAALLLDQVFGDNEHSIHLYCETVAAGYGVCSPCPGFIYECGVGGGGPQTGTCSHDVCTVGGPLNGNCDPCAAIVCAADDFCCNNQWDSLCVSEATQMCSGVSCGPTGGCAHDECSSGGALDANCSTCAGAVCGVDSYCCNSQWDSICVGLVDDNCTKSCGGTTCAHSECTSGPALQSTCSSCVTAVCAADDYCCSTSWDSICVGLVEDHCTFQC